MRSLVVLHPEPSESDRILVELVGRSPIVDVDIFVVLVRLRMIFVESNRRNAHSITELLMCFLC